MAATIKTIVFIPLADNHGIAFAAADWSELFRRLATVAGGATRRGPSEGRWMAPNGTEYVEPVYEVEVDISSWFDLPAFLNVVHWARTHFRQLAIHFEVADSRRLSTVATVGRCPVELDMLGGRRCARTRRRTVRCSTWAR